MGVKLEGLDNLASARCTQITEMDNYIRGPLPLVVHAGNVQTWENKFNGSENTCVNHSPPAFKINITVHREEPSILQFFLCVGENQLTSILNLKLKIYFHSGEEINE